MNLWDGVCATMYTPTPAYFRVKEEKWLVNDKQEKTVCVLVSFQEWLSVYLVTGDAVWPVQSLHLPITEHSVETSWD